MSVTRRLALLAFLPLAFTATIPAWADKESKPNSAVMAEPRKDQWWADRQAGFNERIKKGKVDLLFIGDSITQGWEGDGKNVWEEFYGKRNAVNLGIGGDRTQHVLWRLDNGNLEGVQPKAVVLMIGTNNAGANTSEEIAAGVAAIVVKLRKKLPDTKVLVLAIFPRGADKNDGGRKVNEGANAIIAKLADDKNVFFLDIGPKFLKEDGSLSKEVMPDLLHLNDKSYRIWAESIEPTLKKLLGS